MTNSVSSSHSKRQSTGSKPAVVQPRELLAQVGEPIAGAILWAPDRPAEALVQLRRGRGHEVEAREHAAGREQVVNLAEERALALVGEVMDRQRRDDGVERRGRAERIRQVVPAQLDPGVIGVAGGGAVEHRSGRVEADAAGRGVAPADEREQTAVAGPEIQEPLDPLRQGIEQQRFGEVPVGDLASEVVGDARRIGPLAGHRRAP